MKSKQWIEFDGPDVSFRSHFISIEDADLIRDLNDVITQTTAMWLLLWMVTMNEFILVLLIWMAFLMLFLTGYCIGLDTLPIETKVIENE